MDWGGRRDPQYDESVRLERGACGDPHRRAVGNRMARRLGAPDRGFECDERLGSSLNMRQALLAPSPRARRPAIPSARRALPPRRGTHRRSSTAWRRLICSEATTSFMRRNTGPVLSRSSVIPRRSTGWQPARSGGTRALPAGRVPRMACFRPRSYRRRRSPTR